MEEITSMTEVENTGTAEMQQEAAESAETNPNELVGAEEKASETGAEQQETGTDSESTAPDAFDMGEIEETPSSFTVNIDGEDREVTTEEAAPMLENGKKWERFSESYGKLQLLAAMYGKDVDAYITDLMDSTERTQVEQLMESCGGNNAFAKELYDRRKSEAASRIAASRETAAEHSKNAAADRQQKTQEKLASDFSELSAEFPDKFKKFKDVPRAVVERSVKTGISLYDSYLRYQHSENKKSADAIKTQKAAAVSSTGSMQSAAVESDPLFDSFLSGLNRTLR